MSLKKLIKKNSKTQSSSKPKFIPVCEPLFLGNESAYVRDAVDSGWISSSGKYLKEFEEKFSAYCGVSHGIATTSGTTALHLALKAIDIQPGDEVIIPDFTMAAVLFSVLYCGAKPVFIDAEADTWNMDASKIASKITPKTKAIISVHTYGHPCDMGAILSVAKKHGLKVIEDAAEAHGASYKDKRCGSMGDLACFSFYANKIITSGEGGMVVTSDAQLADRCRYYKNLCFPLKGPSNYQHEDIGFNYRMTNIQAAMGLAQLEHIEEFVERRRENARRYTEQLSRIPGIQCPIEKSYAKNVYWMYGIVIDPKTAGMDRDTLCQKLAEAGVDTRSFFQPMHDQKPVQKQWPSVAKERYPVSENLAKNGFYLPSGSGLKESELRRVCQAIEEIFAAST